MLLESIYLIYYQKELGLEKVTFNSLTIISQILFILIVFLFYPGILVKLDSIPNDPFRLSFKYIYIYLFIKIFNNR